ncbi:MAG: YicC/YloC family endoribonuclease [Spirochaetia bacterium]|nr:YicC family protein [Spirochaetota bacterium]MCX8096665.1 YicC family protein [Spirochaetota bacterium]MDW8112496.1 YicC/YloC family endoribonuclease [Spirochaetia bacterium]
MRSMTGFSYISKDTDYGKITIYLKSLNSRFLEIKTIIPTTIQFVEEIARKVIKNSFKRGKVELVIDFYPKTNDFDIHINKELARVYFESLRSLSNYLGLLPDIEIVDIARMQDVISIVRPEPPLELKKQIEILIKKSVANVLKQRIKEGELVRNECIMAVDKVRKNLEKISERWNIVNTSIEEKVKERVNKFLKEYENRKEIDTSIISFLMKVDINEEIFRLSQHLDDLENLLNSDGELGKKVEFLLQELNREVNTIASKSFDYTISSLVVYIKTELEKIREHIQNIE